MSLRLRLIVSFFFLSVVPLGAVTLYNFITNARALRDVAGRESELLAGELTQRMQVVTTQLSEGVERLIQASAADETPAAAVPVTSTMTAAAASGQVANALGDVAMLLNNIEFRGLRGRRGGGGRGRGTGGPEGPPRGTGGGDATAAAATAAAGEPQRDNRSDGRRGAEPDSPSAQTSIAAGNPGIPPVGNPGIPTIGAPPGPGGREGGPTRGPAGDAAVANETDRILIDMGPIRQEIISQIVPREKWDQLSDDERRQVFMDVDQRVRGIQQGIQMGAIEFQKRLADAQRAADLKAQAAAAEDARRAKAAAAAAAAEAAAAPTRRTTALTDGRIDVRLVSNGEVVGQANAEINFPNLLASVFSATRRDRGEVPFAVSSTGEIFAPTEEDKQKILGLGTDAIDPRSATGTTVLPDWILVTTPGITGLGLKFGIARPIGGSLNELRRTAFRNAAFGFGFICLALIGIVPLSSRLTRNLSTLSEGVRRIADGDYRARVAVHSNDEVGKLAEAFNQMAADVERHQQLAVGQERLRRELELGRQIQHDMLPQVPLRRGLMEIKGVSVPAREVGGDFFNYFELSSGEVALLVGDVSGKGVGAALLMANIQASLRTRLALGQDLAAIANEIDVDIERNTPGPVYATLFVGILDPVSRSLRYVNAGHNPQYVLGAQGGLERMASSGLPIGLLAGRGYSEQRVQLSSGDLLFFYTDGCVEAEAPSGEFFGVERLEALLAGSQRASADELLVRVEGEVAAFRAGREPFDDATMMVVKVG